MYVTSLGVRHYLQSALMLAVFLMQTFDAEICHVIRMFKLLMMVLAMETCNELDVCYASSAHVRFQEEVRTRDERVAELVINSLILMPQGCYLC